MNITLIVQTRILTKIMHLFELVCYYSNWIYSDSEVDRLILDVPLCKWKFRSNIEIHLKFIDDRFF